ncbi:uncharacterized membrane protein (DUF485 family) [Sedimentibacter acidaminivorans]|uniref:Uncharacterized membrane protein (DUF485 family) n=1 Tax=Sedimentibacter acidaminivorans TaxID=913099 RepID=A0ABS4GGR8_9FIRM|nr:hypothetical protein [Sedimentibacter acidaminivorans]MBP1926727.1 uncharacterized membrane protein (DUF485 family) [Sedimentibacter acidaminivorans]
MKATAGILKSIFLQGYTTEKNIILIPLSIIEIIFYIFYSALKKINAQFMLPYIIQSIIISVIFFNILSIVYKGKYRKSRIIILLFFTYPILAEFPEIQSETYLLKNTLNIAWITEIIKEYIFFDVDKSFNRTMTTLFIMSCLIVQLGVNYILVLIPFLLITGNLINISKINWRKK